MKKHGLILLFVLGFCHGWLFAQKPVDNQSYRVEERIVRGDSLSPLVLAGTHVRVLFGYYDNKQVQRGDIVAYNHPANSNPLAKLVKGIPGDRFKLRDTGDGSVVLVLNGKILKNSQGEEYKLGGNRRKMLSLYEKDYHGVIPENTYLLLGDQTDGTLDSTRFGLVDKSGIVGKIERQEKFVEAAQEPEYLQP